MTDAPTPEDALLGTLLSRRYLIERRLGEGGMGAVYQAVDKLFDARVAIKVLLADVAKSGVSTERFWFEAKAAAKIDHPHVIKVADFGHTENGIVFMVLELLEGRDWSKDLDAQRQQPVAKVASILSQVCSALAATHEKGIVHRDLKPSNVFLIERDGRDFVKLLDFGISKVRSEDDAPSALTKTGEVFGTLFYMSPEQVSGRAKEADARTDLWAVGVMLYEALTGRRPFGGATQAEVIGRILFGPLDALARYRPDVPKELVELCHGLLAQELSKRPSDARAVQEALQQFSHADAAPIAVAPPNPPAAVAQEEPAVKATAPQNVEVVSAPSPPRVETRTARWLVAIAVVAVITIGSLLFEQVQDRSSTSFATQPIEPPPAAKKAIVLDTSRTQGAPVSSAQLEIAKPSVAQSSPAKAAPHPASTVSSARGRRREKVANTEVEGAAPNVAAELPTVAPAPPGATPPNAEATDPKSASSPGGWRPMNL